MTYFISVDAGTMYFKVATYDETGQPVPLILDNGEAKFISVVYFEPDGRVLIGEEALNAGAADPGRCIKHWKRYMGSDKPAGMGPNGQPIMGWEVLAICLGKVKNDVETKSGLVLSDLVVTVPANFTDRQKAETEMAATKAGLKVLYMPHEPIAASFGNKLHEVDGIHLVVDVGGGTTDVSVVETTSNKVRTLRSAGVPKLGGVDYSEALQRHVVDGYQKKYRVKNVDPLALYELQNRIESAKTVLSSRDKATIVLSSNGKSFSCAVTQDEFNQMTAQLTQQVVDCATQTLSEAGVEPKSLKRILLVGGGARVPAIGKALEAKLGRPCSGIGENTFAAAFGGVILGRIAVQKKGDTTVTVTQRILPPVPQEIKDVTTYDIGVAALDQARVLRNSVILAAGTDIPSTSTIPFQLADEDQTGAHIMVLQGKEGALPQECQKLGEFHLTDLPQVRGVHRIDIRMEIDRNGMLKATAIDPACGKTAELEIDYRKSEPPTAS